MKRIATANRYIDKFGPGKDGFRAAVPGVSDPTYLSADWCDGVTESIVRVQELAGLEPSDDHNQFGDALKIVIGQVVPSIGQFYRPTDLGDYSAAVQRAIDSGEPVITGSGRSYTVGGSFTGRGNLCLRDVVLDVPGLSSNAYVFDFSGTEGTPQVLAADLAAESISVTVPDGSAFELYGEAFLRSDEYWAPATGDDVKYGESVRIASIVGNVLTFYGMTLCAYTVAKGATITPVHPLRNIMLENVVSKGPVSTLNQGGLLFYRCADVNLINVGGADMDYTHILFKQSVRGTVRGGSLSRTGVQEGLDYGVVASYGCYDILIDGLRADSLRHPASIGGSQGINRFITVTNCRGTNLTDAGLDSHSACHEHTFVNNFLHFSDDADTTIDGIASQGTALIASGNQIVGCKRHGIAWTPEVLSAFTGPVSAEIGTNKMRGKPGASTSGVLVATPTSGSGYAPIASVTIVAPQVSGFSNAVTVQANTTAINRAVVDGVQCDGPMSSRSVYIAATGADINSVQVSGGNHEVDAAATNPVIDMIGTGAFRVKNVRVVAPHMKRGAGGTIGMRIIKCDNVSETGSTTDNITTKYSVDVDSTGVTLDRRKSTTVTMTNSTYTVLAQDENLIANRAGTITITLPAAAIYPGRELPIKTVQAQLVVSAASDVVPITDTVAGTAILPATDGAWARLKSDGANWIVMAKG